LLRYRVRHDATGRRITETGFTTKEEHEHA
jgi:hypothetical protein